jgi:hypothetical protein
MAIEMHVPNKQYDGYYGGVRFHKGVGIFEDVEKAKELAKRYGFEIVSPEGEKEVEVKAEVAEKPAPKKRVRKKPAPKAGE